MNLNLEHVLNEEQMKAVCDTEGRVLVLAGAGSGKTRVLTYRVAHLVAKGISPYSILAITFTNKATAEMKVRLNQLLGENNGVWVSTFHSLCASILRRDANKLGYGRNFSIYDESDSLKVLRKVIKEKHLEDNPLKERVGEYISEAKNKGLTPEQYYQEINGTQEEAKLITEVFARYEELLFEANAMDFDDLLHKTKKLFLEFDDVLSQYQMKFRYIHVDEFQDTNAVQYDLVRMLSEKWENLFVVGDDDQSIYGWRGAIIDNILYFDRDYPDAKVYRLEQNYRSTSEILDAANRVIAHNASRHEKTLRPNCGKGVRVEYYNAYNDRQEAEWVLEQILVLKRCLGYRNKDFAILVRINSLTRLFETMLAGARLNYRVLGGFKFFDRKEVQDVVAYLRLISNSHDAEAFERAVSFPPRGIGSATIEKINGRARFYHEGPFDYILSGKAGRELGGGAAKKVEEFRTLLSDLVSARTLSLGEYVQYLVDRVDFKRAYEKSGKEEDAVRYENVMEFVRHVREYEKQHKDATIEEFLETVRLIPERDEEIFDGDKITVATMHAVKGLEFRAVFIVACEERLFPIARALEASETGLEEERRLMYVAITRAKERLFVSYAQRRLRYDRVEVCKPSRFIAEMRGEKKEEDSYVLYGERKRQLNAISRQNSPDWIDPWRNESSTTRLRVFGNESRASKESTPQLKTKNVFDYVAGVKVEHSKYGVGTIVLASGEGKERIVTVAFSKVGLKKFAVAFADLKIL